MRPSSPGLAGAFARRRRQRRRRRRPDRARLHRPALLRLRPPRPAPASMFTASHNPAAYNGIKMCRAQAVPDRGGHRADRDPRRGRGRAAATGAEQGEIGETRRAGGVRRPPADAGPGARATPEGRRRRRQRDGRAHRSRGVRAARGRAGRAGAALLRARRHLPQPRGQPDRAGEPASTSRRGSSPRAPTSGWPSTATPTAASSSTSAGEAVAPSTLTALIAARELAREPGATRDPQPDHQPRRAARS